MRKRLAFGTRDKRHRILIVEDDWAILEVLKLMLEDEGHAVTTAKHGKEAVAIASTKSFDLVLMDISMPEMSGIEVATFLRSNEKTVDVLIAIHTGLDEHWVRDRFSDYDLFLTKATDTHLLVQAIAKLFASPQVGRGRRSSADDRQAFTAADLAVARTALRAETGVKDEGMPAAAFLAALDDEVRQLRKVGRSDADIAQLIGKAIGRDVAAATVERHVPR